MIETTLEKLPNGNLRIHVTLGDEEEDRKGIAEMREHLSDYDILCEWLEPYLCNGWAFFTADALGFLSEAPMLLEDVDYNEEGMVTGWAAGWYNPDYMVTGEVDIILRDGYFDFVPFED